MANVHTRLKIEFITEKGRFLSFASFSPVVVRRRTKHTRRTEKKLKKGDPELILRASSRD